ncbi:hypothetical protein AOLI_G00301880 [Acnodon oligacanthus]
MKEVENQKRTKVVLQRITKLSIDGPSRAALGTTGSKAGVPCTSPTHKLANDEREEGADKLCSNTQGKKEYNLRAHHTQ